MKQLGGQPVKTRQLYYALVDYYGKDNITCIETYGWKFRPIKVLSGVLMAAKKHDIMIMLPAHHGVQVFARLLSYCKKVKGVKIFYDVIGGWLPQKTKQASGLTKALKQFDGIWVETTSMRNALLSQGFDNVTVVPNFKNLSPVETIKKDFAIPFPICTFSRVMQEKGIEDAINAVISVNTSERKVIYALDIYGPIYEPYKERFEKLQSNFPPYIKYRGIVDPTHSVDTLKDYFALLFPTRFYTEGIPGTLIDALFSGVPVISSRWINYEDILKDDVTGWGYQFCQIDELKKLLMKAYAYPEKFIAMRVNCVKEASNYQSESAINKLNVLIEKTRNV